MAHLSRRTHSYYRAAIVPGIRQHCGYESNHEAHTAIKAAFYGMHPDDPKLPSMAKMTQEEAGRFIDYALREAAELGLVLEDPRKVTT